MQRFLDKAGLERVWERTKNYVDSKIDSDSNGSFPSIGTVQWEDIVGRPDLSSVSSMKVAQIVLSGGLWDEGKRQTAIVPGVLEDENQQLIVPVPKKADKSAYYNSGIECVDQEEDALIFSAAKVPEADLHINVYIFGAAEVSEEVSGTFEWWSPRMTGDMVPVPYAAGASSTDSSSHAAHKAFDADGNTYCQSKEEKDSWLQFDFGIRTYISGIRLAPWGSTPNNIRKLPKVFDLAGSNDGSNWNTIFQSDGREYPEVAIGEKYTYTFAPKSYRYYRIVCKENYSGNFQFAIAEWEFYKLEDAE